MMRIPRYSPLSPLSSWGLLILMVCLGGCPNELTTTPSGTEPSPSIEPTASASVSIQDVQIVPVPRPSSGSLILNALPASGDPEPQYTVSWQLSAEVQASDGRPRRVTWSSSDLTRLTVDEQGFVRTVRGATQGEAFVKATSVDDPNLWDDIKILVTNYGDLTMEVN